MAGSTINGAQVFVDLDGDGFNDYLADSDGDGIPEWPDARQDGSIGVDNTAPRGKVISLGQFAASGVESRTTLFERRSFMVRSLSTCRSDFEALFGGGLGVTLGSAAGGACAGGICVPRSLW